MNARLWKNIWNKGKVILDSWTVSEILFTSAIICIQSVADGNKIVKYLQNYKRNEFDQGHSRKLW